jgi:SAM-dependent methyltransferase
VEPTEENIRAWNELHRRWAEAYAGPPQLSLEARELLPELRSKHVLHVRCGTGETSAQLVELGALVTGIDLDEDALAAARGLAQNALFERADLLQLPPHLRRRRFHLVYAGPGALREAQDLPVWAAKAAGALRPGGELFVHEIHPVADCLDPASLRWRADYFELPWQLGEVVSAVAGSGLQVTRLVELRPPSSPRRQDPRVPGEYVLRAVKPS